MSQITLRGMDPEVENTIRQEALKTGKSLNRVVLEMIYRHTRNGKTEREPLKDSLRQFAGGWTETDAKAFSESVKSFDRIDESMWK